MDFNGGGTTALAYLTKMSSNLTSPGEDDIFYMKDARE